MAETRAGEAKKLRLELWLQGLAIHLTREGWDEQSLLYVLGRKKPHWLKRVASLPANVQDKLARDADAVLNNQEVRAYALRHIASYGALFERLFGLAGLTDVEQEILTTAKNEEKARYAAEEPAAEPESPRPLESPPPPRRYRTGTPNFEARAKMDRVRSGLAISLVRNGWPPQAIIKMLGMTGSHKWLERLRSLPATEQDALVTEAGAAFQPAE